MSQAILDFYRGTGLGAGRTLEQVLAFDDFLMERSHDYIQWMFPLPEPSKAQPQSPVLTWEEVLVFQRDEAIRANVRLAFDRWMDFMKGTDHWLRPRDHNHLRITRVIRFLTIIGMDEEAEQVYHTAVEMMVEHVGDYFPKTTEWYWKEARHLEPAWLAREAP